MYDIKYMICDIHNIHKQYKHQIGNFGNFRFFASSRPSVRPDKSKPLLASTETENLAIRSVSIE